MAEHHRVNVTDSNSSISFALAVFPPGAGQDVDNRPLPAEHDVSCPDGGGPLMIVCPLCAAGDDLTSDRTRCEDASGPRGGLIRLVLF